MKRILTLGMSKIHIKDVWLFVAQVLLLSLVMLSPGLICSWHKCCCSRW